MRVKKQVHSFIVSQIQNSEAVGKQIWVLCVETEAEKALENNQAADSNPSHFWKANNSAV